MKQVVKIVALHLASSHLISQFHELELSMPLPFIIRNKINREYIHVYSDLISWHLVFFQDRTGVNNLGKSV